jgi:hypothetical protein
MHTRSSDAEDCIQAERSQDQQGGFGKELELVGSRVESDAGRGQRPVHQTTAWKASVAKGKKPVARLRTPWPDVGQQNGRQRQHASPRSDEEGGGQAKGRWTRGRAASLLARAMNQTGS